MDLLERDSELGELHELLRAAASGQGRLLFLSGEAGIGKTTLVEALARQAGSQAQVVVASFDGLSTPDALGPVLDVAPELGIPRSALTSPDLSREAIFRRLLDALTSRQHPIVLVGDDAHWADEATINLVRYLGRRIGKTRTLLIVTFRDDELGTDHPLRVLMGDLASVPWVRRMTLPRLSPDAVTQMAAGQPVDPAALYRVTGGNPFFVREVLRTGDGDVPASVRDVVLGRAARLRPNARSTLDAASMLGVRVEPDLLRAVQGRWVEDDIEQCLAVGLLEADHGEVAFRHALAWQAIRSSVTPLRVVAYNRRVLALLDAKSGPVDHARLALHAEEARDADAVLRHAVAAAEQASALSAHREAAAQYARALRFAGSLPAEQRADLLEHESLEWYLSGQLGPAIEARTRAVELSHELGDRRREGDDLRWLSQLLGYDGRIDESRVRGHEARELLESLPPGPELAWAYASLAQAVANARLDDPQAIDFGKRAIALAEETGATEALVQALRTVGALMELGVSWDGRHYLERSLELARKAGYQDQVARALDALAAAEIGRAALKGADDYIAEGVAWCSEHDLMGWERRITARRAWVHLYKGEWADAVRDVNAAQYQASSSPAWGDVAMEVRRWIEVWQGIDNRMVLDLLLERPERPNQYRSDLLGVRLLRAEAAWLRGDVDALHREALAAHELVRDNVPHWFAGEIALYLRNAGDRPLNVEYAFEPYRLQLEGDWRGAADQWRELGYPLRTARALMDGDVPAVREALGIFEQLGARPDAQIAKARLRKLGASRIPTGTRTPAPSKPGGLTAREIEVLTLIADGKHDREIAQQLFLSPRTVGHHVSSILAKLDVPTRTAAASAATRMGILERQEHAASS